MQQYYQILGLPTGASKDEVRKAFRRLARQWHPDVNKSPEAATQFMKINEAYEIIIGERKAPKRNFTYSPAKSDAPKKTNAQSRADERRERIKNYHETLLARFLDDRETKLKNVRASKNYFLSKILFNYGICAFFAILCLVFIIAYQKFFMLVAMLILVKPLAPFLMDGWRAHQKMKMVFGDRTDYSIKELTDIYFYDELRKSRREKRW